MLDGSVLEVAVGLAIIFLIFSLVVSGLYEAIAKVLAWRAKALWAAIHLLVDGAEEASTHADRIQRLRHVAPEGDLRPMVGANPSTRTEDIYAHPLVGGLERRAATVRTRIDRIEPGNFARALIDVLVPDGQGQTTLEHWRAALVANREVPPALKRQLLLLLREAAGDLNAFRSKVEDWFDGQMTMLSQSYRKRAKWFMVIFGLAVAVACNVNAIAATEQLFRDDALRAALVSQGERITDECADKDDNELTTCLQDASDEVGQAVRLPVGWQDADVKASSILGWIASGLAISQGAPFWFNTLKRVVGSNRRRAPDTGPSQTRTGPIRRMRA